MSVWFSFILLLVIAYLLGSICSAIPICRLFGLPDPRSTGSANPGASNVMRLGGKWPAVLTFLTDAFKGTPPILLGYALGLSITQVSLIAVAAILGHLYPLYYQFKGGKGVATAFGTLLVLDWRLFVVAGFAWLAIFVLARISSVASLGSMLLAVPIASYLLNDQLLIGVSLIGLLILWRHQQNIRDLVSGAERQFRS
ncbi:MAG: glycerol-3-phosphate 1-O-acyltransferase PlsY [Pseudomonadota bacterium]|nr:glycerol-3-phosphate 1-O-acyltransferase PlsY [Pseudomonadota bacterium]